MVGFSKYLAWIAFAFFAVCGAAPSPAQAAQRALLVGVSKYMYVKPDLIGPKQDLTLMRDLLRKQGFADPDITILADAPPEGSPPSASPTLANIEAALKDMVEKAANGDFVVLYFSGHGSYQSQPTPKSPAGDAEPDYRDEVFLPIDAGASKKYGLIDKALVDDRVGESVTAVRDKGASVWVIFDSCYSGDMLRGIADGAIQRFIDPATIAVDDGSAREPPPTPSSLGPPATDWTKKKSLDRIAAFYAVKSDQTAIEKPMPCKSDLTSDRPGASGQAHCDDPQSGVFTYLLVKAIKSRQGKESNFRQIAQAVAAEYDVYGSQLRTPFFEGALDNSLFGASESKVQGWAAHKTGAGSIRLDAGDLQSLDPGALFELTNSDNQSLGFAEIETVDIASSELRPKAHAGQPAPDVARLPDMFFATLVERSVSFVLTVAGLPDDDKKRDDPASLGASEAVDLLKQPRKDDRLLVHWVPHGAKADVTFRYRDGLIYLLRESGELVTEEDVRKSEGSRERSPAVAVASTPTATAALLHDNLWRAARYQNLLRIEKKLPEDALEDLTTSVFLLRDPATEREKQLGDRRDCADPTQLKTYKQSGIPEAAQPVTSVSTELHHCDTVFLEIVNTGLKPVDVTVLYLDGEEGVQAFRPGGRTRLEPRYRNSTILPIGIRTWGRISEDKDNSLLPVGMERLMVIAVEGDEKDSEPQDFSNLQQASLDRAVRIRGETKRGGTAGELSNLLEQAALAPDQGATRAAIGLRGGEREGAAAIRVFRWEVRRATQSFAAAGAKY